jgi:tetratricopeptide (TPR) repeat protein
VGSRRGPAYWVGLCVGWLLVGIWQAMVWLNALPYVYGAATPSLGELLTRLVTPPGLPLAPELAALVGWALAAVMLGGIFVLVALTLSPPVAKPSAKPPIAPPARPPTPPVPESAAPARAPAGEAAAPIASVVEAAPTTTPTTATAPETQPVPTQRKRRVFISHASKDNDFGGSLVERLRRELGPGYDIWYDSKGRPGPDGLWADGIAPGQNWQDEIMRAFKDADVFLVILSEAAMASPWVADELGMAWSRKNVSPNIEAGLVAVPVLRETCDAPLWLSLIQWVNFTGWQAEGWDGGTQAWEALLSAVRDTRTRARPLELAGPPFDLALLPPLERFIGREQAVKDVIALLTGPGAGQQANVAAANGLGGIGKTALATEVARRLMGRRDFPDGIAVVDCREQHTPEEARALLRRALGRFTDGRKEPESDDPAELSDAARKILAGKRALVILDNVERDLPARQIISPLRSAGAAVLSTSREPLAAVPAGATLRLDVLPEEEAMELFEQYLGRELSDEEERAARVIVSALGRHTLATKLAAANAATLGRPLAAIAHELETNPNKAMLLASSDEAVLWVMESSAKSLTPEARRLFAALAAFATSDIGRMAAQAVAQALDDPNPDASLDRLLSLRLADSGYLEALPGGDEADRERVRLHPLVRQYAGELFDGKRTVGDDLAWTADQREDVERAIAAWYADYTNGAPDLALTPDEANITGALDWALAHSDDRAAARICVGIRGFWRDTGRTRAGLKYLRLGMVSAGRVAQSGERNDIQRYANIELYYADILKDTGKPAEAEQVYMVNIERWRAIDHRQGEGVVLSSLGQLALQRGRLEEAEGYFQQSLAIDREVSDRRGEGVDLSELGQIALQRGRLEEAERYFEASLAIDREVSDRQGEGIDLSNLGRIALRRGRLEEAEGYFQQSLAVLREVSDRRGEGAVLYYLALIADQRDDLESAERYHRESLQVAIDIGAMPDVPPSLVELGKFLIVRRGKRGEGCAMLREAARLCDEMGIPGGDNARDAIRELGCGE